MVFKWVWYLDFITLNKCFDLIKIFNNFNMPELQPLQLIKIIIKILNGNLKCVKTKMLTFS